MEITNISMPVAALLASLIGATATITAALLQLRIAWRKEMQERAQHKPVTKKAKRGPITPILVLVLASSVGGFALAYYMTNSARARTAELEESLNRRLQQLDNVQQLGLDVLQQQLRLDEALRAGRDGVATQLAIGKCGAGGDVSGAVECSEQQPLQLRLCVELPAAASVSDIALFARGEGEVREWRESRVAAGKDFGGGRFSESASERLLDESHKQVCQGIDYWSRSGVVARMVVHYVPAQAEGAKPPSAPLPHKGS